MFARNLNLLLPYFSFLTLVVERLLAAIIYLPLLKPAACFVRYTVAKE